MKTNVPGTYLLISTKIYIYIIHIHPLFFQFILGNNKDFLRTNYRFLDMYVVFVYTYVCEINKASRTENRWNRLNTPPPNRKTTVSARHAQHSVRIACKPRWQCPDDLSLQAHLAFGQTVVNVLKRYLSKST